MISYSLKKTSEIEYKMLTISFFLSIEILTYLLRFKVFDKTTHQGDSVLVLYQMYNKIDYLVVSEGGEKKTGYYVRENGFTL